MECCICRMFCCGVLYDDLVAYELFCLFVWSNFWENCCFDNWMLLALLFFRVVLYLDICFCPSGSHQVDELPGISYLCIAGLVNFFCSSILWKWLLVAVTTECQHLSDDLYYDFLFFRICNGEFDFPFFFLCIQVDFLACFLSFGCWCIWYSNG